MRMLPGLLFQMNETICMVMSIKLSECDVEQGGFFGGVGIVCGRSVV